MVTSLTNRAVVLVKVNPAHWHPQMQNLEEAPAFCISQILHRAQYHYHKYSASNFRPPAWAPDGKHIKWLTLLYFIWSTEHALCRWLCFGKFLELKRRVSSCDQGSNTCLARSHVSVQQRNSHL